MANRREKQEHPKGNTDAQPTTPTNTDDLPANYKEGLSCSFDWFSTTFPPDATMEDVLKALDIDAAELTEMENGMHGYKRQYRFQNDVIILDEGKKNMGIHVVMTGNGCRIMENREKWDWRAVCSLLTWMGNKFPRVDVAVDEMRRETPGFFTLEMIEEKLITEQWVSYWQDAYVITHYKRGNKMSPKEAGGLADLREEIERAEEDQSKRRRGKTIYFGSARSRVRARFYDKKEERIAKGHGCNLQTWNRCELQMRDVKAKEFLARYVIAEAEIGKQVAEHLMHYLRFVEPKKTDGNRHRWETVDWWAEFLTHVERMPITLFRPAKTIEKTVRWLKRYVSAAIAMIADLADSTDWIDLIISEGKAKQKEQHKQLVTAARESGTNVEELLSAA